MTEPKGEGSAEAALAQLRAEWGIGFTRVRDLICHLAQRGRSSIPDLVAATQLSRRSVQEIARRLEPWIVQEGDALEWTRPARVLADELACGGAETGADDEPDLRRRALAREMSDVAAGLPAPVRHLDHVLATADTAVERALFLNRTYHLEGAHLVCLGDRDLTSIAVGLLRPEQRTTVVDVDDRILDLIAKEGGRRGLRIETRFGDFRVALPPSVARSGDLVFTDPPYTAEGVKLFLTRAIEALREDPSSRVVFSYGFSERHPAHGLEVQEVLDELHLLAEAILPGFNRYVGAEAIGSASSLYVCRPTRRTRAAAAAAAASSRIYTRGRSARESQAEALPPGLVDEVLRRVAGAAGPIAVVGDGWSRNGGLPKGPRMSVIEYLRPILGGEGSPAPIETVLVDLHPDFGALVLRVLLAGRAQKLVVVADERDLRRIQVGAASGALRTLVESAYRVEALEVAADSLGAALFEQRPGEPEDATRFVLRWLVRHPEAKVANSWREALVAAAARRGRNLTKNDARALIAEAGGAPAAQLLELPLHDVRALVAAVRKSAAAL
jgi:hypothetical protein